MDLDTQKEALKKTAEAEAHIIQHPSIPTDEYVQLQKDVNSLQTTADELAAKAQYQAKGLVYLGIDCSTFILAVVLL